MVDYDRFDGIIFSIPLLLFINFFNEIYNLGSTGSIGSSTLKSIQNNNNFKINYSTNNNINKIYKQAIKYNVKNVIVEDKLNFKI